MPDPDRMKGFVHEAFDISRAPPRLRQSAGLIYWHARFSTTGRMIGRSWKRVMRGGRFWSQTVPWLGAGNRAHDAIAGGKGELFHRNLASSA
jgi:hypothetical protein